MRSVVASAVAGSVSAPRGERGRRVRLRAGPRRELLFDVVAVEVDEPRHDHPPVGVDHGVATRRGRRVAIDTDDALARDDDASALDDARRGHDPSVPDLGELRHRVHRLRPAVAVGRSSLRSLAGCFALMIASIGTAVLLLSSHNRSLSGRF